MRIQDDNEKIEFVYTSGKLGDFSETRETLKLEEMSDDQMDFTMRLISKTFTFFDIIGLDILTLHYVTMAILNKAGVLDTYYNNVKDGTFEKFKKELAEFEDDLEDDYEDGDEDKLEEIESIEDLIENVVNSLKTEEKSPVDMTEEDFLKELQNNPNFRKYTYKMFKQETDSE